MSLQPDDRASRTLHESPAGARPRSNSNARAPSPGPAYNTTTAQPQYNIVSPPGVSPVSQDAALQPVQALPGLSSYTAPITSEPVTMGDYTDLPPNERPQFMQQAQVQYTAPQAVNPLASPNIQYAQPAAQIAQHSGFTMSVPSTGTMPQVNRTVPQYQTAQPGGIQYAAMPGGIKYTATPVTANQGQPAVAHTKTAQPKKGTSSQQPKPAYTMNAKPQLPQQNTLQSPAPSAPARAPSPQPASQAYAQNANIVEIVPGGGGKLGAPPSPGLRPHRLSVHGQRPDLGAPPSPGLVPRMDRLSVSGNRPDMSTLMPGGFPGAGGMLGGLPPPSPLLEAYHGTYQSISPMPSPMMLPHDDELDMLPQLSPQLSGPSFEAGGRRRHRAHSSASSQLVGPLAEMDGQKEKRRVKLYPAEDDARDIADALGRRSGVDNQLLIDILPTLSHDQILELRTEYKRVAKVQGRGINITKHIKLKTSGNFGKICYVTALGRWESEGYWANYWYQSQSSKRELLIEALMGRSNRDIRAIKQAFSDKRYGDSLARCMDAELKRDKFRTAVLTVLDEARQEEYDVWPIEYRNRDVDALHEALSRREGGESAMLQIVITRSDAHLREVLRTFERKYHVNFARQALKKSNNLVGEIIAHVLNGALNRPARDAMLLRHALLDLQEPPAERASSPTKHARQQRWDLLISRLVRLHWEPKHLRVVKREYREKYGRYVEEDIEDACRGDFGEFCLALLEV
ncbi:hypothetical protein H2201_006717 [Coniosporium apollinis]|uniref:Annexin n=1 Tax=Coniosporium apollinis TaxID=61459 RepID=A0ABQ9NRF8_9PEZI|nr:hypothetical protein H2201_006717 [Coniosporium apollinis]